MNQVFVVELRDIDKGRIASLYDLTRAQSASPTSCALVIEVSPLFFVKLLDEKRTQ